MTISILLADDHQIVRQGLRALLETEGDFRLIGEAGSGLEAIQLTERLHPDVLILDLMMPDLNGLEVTRQIHQYAPQTRIVILSMHDDEAYVSQTLRHGAAAYVLKEASFTDLATAVRAEMAGHRYLSAPLSDRAITAYLEKTDEAAMEDPYATLTSRERAILSLIAEGHNNTEIGTQLSISPRTVESHRRHLMQKLNLHSQAELVRYAIKRSLLPPE